jgi:homocysteine S-methyltransferase
MTTFPEAADGVLFLTEGGQETEAMYRHGHPLPEFALFTLLDQPDGLADLHHMYDGYLQVAAETGFVPLMGGLDYRLSPDWVARLGLARADIAALQERCLDFLRQAAGRWEDRVPQVLTSGIVGPRGDAYAAPGAMSAEEAAGYHATQVGALAASGADLVQAMTFGSVDEAVGLAWAAADAGLPLVVSFMPGADQRLLDGHTLRDAVLAVDERAGDQRPEFYGINCAHPTEFEPALDGGEWTERIRMLRPNASYRDKIELCQIGHLEEGDPPALGSRMGALARQLPHVDVWGGCCGTWDSHLREITSEVASAR